MQIFVVLNSINIYYNNFIGEGLDFKVEIVNKDVQFWMLRGVLLGEDWLCVIRNLEYFKEVSIDYVGVFNMVGKKYWLQNWLIDNYI